MFWSSEAFGRCMKTSIQSKYGVVWLCWTRKPHQASLLTKNLCGWTLVRPNSVFLCVCHYSFIYILFRYSFIQLVRLQEFASMNALSDGRRGTRPRVQEPSLTVHQRKLKIKMENKSSKMSVRYENNFGLKMCFGKPNILIGLDNSHLKTFRPPYFKV